MKRAVGVDLNADSFDELKIRSGLPEVCNPSARSFMFCTEMVYVSCSDILVLVYSFAHSRRRRVMFASLSTNILANVSFCR